MSMLAIFVGLAGLCVIGSLALGIVAMAKHGEIGHRTSAQWMSMRIGFQGLALALILIALVVG